MEGSPRTELVRILAKEVLLVHRAARVRRLQCVLPGAPGLAAALARLNLLHWLVKISFFRNWAQNQAPIERP